MSTRDDHVMAGMRWVSLVVVLVLLPALVILWGFPDKTHEAWAWTIKPDLTPIFMGAGYGAGAYFFLRVFMGRSWHAASIGVLGAGVFATLMLITTILHYDKFNQGDGPVLAVIAFFGWVGVYIASPFVVGGLWYLNQRTDPRVAEPGDAVVPAGVRLAARVAATGALAVALMVLVWPEVAIDNWGWKLTPLTARVLACFTTQVGTAFLVLSFEPRWSSWKLLVQTFLLAVLLLMVGAARAWGAFDTGRWLTWAYVVGLGGCALTLAGLYLALERGRSAPAASTA